MSRLAEFCKRLWNENVQMERHSIEFLAAWEPVSATTGDVWRHKGCGSLVKEADMEQHVKEQHSKRAAICIRFFDDGTTEIACVEGYLVTHEQSKALHNFELDQMQLALDKFEANRAMRNVVPFPPSGQVH